MFNSSLILGIFGILVTGLLLRYLNRGNIRRSPERSWFLGLAALFPAWLAAFLDLVPGLAPGSAPLPLPRPLIFSSGAALLGIIFTHYVLRRLMRPATPPTGLSCWLLGLAALVPGWGILLWSLS